MLLECIHLTLFGEITKKHVNIAIIIVIKSI
jgi:hypothetical protein